MTSSINEDPKLDLELILQTYGELKSTRKAAEKLGLSRSTFRRRLAKATEQLGRSIEQTSQTTVEESNDQSYRVISAKGVRTLTQLVKVAGIDLSKWVVIKKVINKWDAVSRDGVIDLWQVKVWLERRPEYYASPVKPVSLRKRAAPPKSSPQNLQTCLVIPDAQVGFRRSPEGELEPLHDRLAMDVVLQVCEELRPCKIIILGDMLDLAPWSTKYSTDPGLRFTTQHSLVELFWFLGCLRETCPESEIVYLEGNHENRIERALKEKVDEALDVRPANDPKGLPSLSIPRLLSLDSIDIDYRGPYGASYWLWDEVRIHHGHVVRGNSGGTTSAILNNSSHSQIVGHIHRVESHSKTIQVAEGSKIITAMSPGCLCRLDDAVPGFAGKPKNWQQGFGLVHKDDKGVAVTSVPILNGRAILNQKVFVGEDYTSKLSEDTGLKF